MTTPVASQSVSDLSWTGGFILDQNSNFTDILQHLAQAFNQSPFFVHNQFSIRVIDDRLQGYFDMHSHLIGNVAYQILHGGVIASILDSIGGVATMAELYRRALAQPEKYNFDLTKTQSSRLATLDMRVDYLKPGRGKWFTTEASPLRLGNKSALMRMDLINDQHETIATAIASYSF